MSRRHKLRPKPLERPKKQKKTRKRGAWWYVYYPHLQEKLQKYGMPISCRNYIGLQVVTACALFFFCEIFQMQIPYRFLVVLTGILFFPCLLKNRRKRRFEEERFTEVGIYMEQMLYAFQKEQKITASLKNVKTLFPKGRMHGVLERAWYHIEQDYISESPVHAALQEIEQVYACDRLHTLHQFMEKVERLGGHFDNSIELLLNDKHLWEKRMLERKEAESTMRNVVVSIMLSLLVCVSTISFMPDDMDILAFGITHLSAAVILCLDLFILYKADQKLTCDWLNPQTEVSDENLENQYLRLIQYDEKKEQKRSLLYSIVPAVLLVGAIILQQTGKSIFFGGLLLICLFQHKLGHSLNQRRVIREVEKVFPQWLMEIALLLQVDNVQVSLQKTYPRAPAILKPALSELLKKLEYRPQEVAPYTEFLQELELPEIQAAMKMLYSISNGTGGDASQQIYEIIQRNHLLLDKAEKIKQEEEAAGCNIYFLLPMLSGALKLILDLSVFLVAFLQMGGQTVHM